MSEPRLEKGGVGGLLVVLALLVLVNSALLTEVGLYSRNTLEFHPEWLLGKSLLHRVPFGTPECASTRNLMARNELNLEVWHGLQEVLLNRVTPLDRARFRYRLREGAYLAVILQRTPEGFTGLRLSRREALPPVSFHSDPEGQFREHQPLALSQGPGWHWCDLTRRGADLELSVDGQKLTVPGMFPAPKGVFGFRGSIAVAEVDNVEVWEGDQRVVRESFRNDRHARAAALFCLAVTLLLTLGLALLHRLRGLGTREALLWTLLGHFACLMGLIFFWLVDYIIWSSRYCENEPPERARRALASLLDGCDPPEAQQRLPLLEFLQAPPRELAGAYRVEVMRDGQVFRVPDTAQGVRDFRRDHPHQGPCVVVLGASQIWGEGAYHAEDAMCYRIQAELKELWGQQPEVINAAHQGTNSGELKDRYEDHLRLFEPEVVVIYQGSNDKDMAAFSANLQALGVRNRERGTVTVIVMEANSPENPPTEEPFLARKLPVMKEAAERQHLPCLDLESYLSTPEMQQSGFIWWDTVHPTSYGHRLAGRFIAEGVARVYRPK